MKLFNLPQFVMDSKRFGASTHSTKYWRKVKMFVKTLTQQYFTNSQSYKVFKSHWYHCHPISSIL